MNASDAFKERLESLFAEALDLPPEQRGSFIDTSTADNSELRDQLRSLLAQDESDEALLPIVKCDDFQDIARWLSDAASELPQVCGSYFGRYRIVSLLGRGGMGFVYEAEQERPRRHVALKVVRGGLLTPKMIKRFEYEVETLGQLDHPDVARVYDAGLVNGVNGTQPYFVMELVRGKTLDKHIKYVTEISQRFQLLLRIVAAVKYAHQKGVLHRDLKPANIMVTDSGDPKLLDFGVARATHSDVSALTSNHSTGLIGTLQYMSPEQTLGNSKVLDFSSDVYALGVIAFEVLSGRRPYEVDGLPLDRALEVIRTAQPPSLRKFDPHISKDIEAVVAKALDKDHLKRFADAGEFAAALNNCGIHFGNIMESSKRDLSKMWIFVVMIIALLFGAFGIWKARDAEIAKEALERELEQLKKHMK